MTKTIQTILFGTVALIAASCSSDDLFVETIADEISATETGITMTVPAFTKAGATRTTVALDETTGLTFSWAEDDLVGVFGSQDEQQVKLTLSEGAGSSKATFTSNDFQLSAASTYCAYYPMVNSVTASAQIPLDYTGQTQNGNSSIDHLGDYDFMASDAVTPTATNNAAFTLSHLGVAVRLQITVPEAGTWTKIKLSTDTPLFATTDTLSLFSETQLTTTDTSRVMTLNLENVTMAAGETLTAWLMLAPADLSGKTITVTVYDSDGKAYVGEISGEQFSAGSAYSLSTTVSEQEPFLSSKFMVGTSSYVYFTSGNLQYDIDANKYRLASTQWEYLNTATGSNSTKATANYFTATDNYITATPACNFLDLFCYGTGTNPTLASGSQSDYTTFNDWGTTAANDLSSLSGARTLTSEEWLALIRNQYYALVKLQTSDNATTFGLVVFPYDTDETTANSYLTEGTVKKMGSNSTLAFASSGSMTVANLKASGALFLPAAGKTCSGTSAYLGGVQGSYQSSTMFSSGTSYGFAFLSYAILAQSDDNIEDGEAVRLVKDAD